MNKSNEKVNKYLALNSIKSSKDGLPFDKKKEASYKVSNKELAEGIYSWDPAISRFIRVGR